METWSEIWFNDDYVYGGTDTIVTTFIGDSPVPMFEDPPKCWFHRQANWITGFFPETVTRDDYDFYYFPPVDEAYGKPFLVAGDIMAMFNDRPEVRATMEYFTVPESVSGFLEQGGALAAHKTVTPDMYGQDIEQGIAKLIQEATSFRFDASDLMPGEVGAGSFWKGMTDYVSGAADLDTVLNEIDTSWPEGVAGLSESSDASEEEVAAEEEPTTEGPTNAPAGGFLERAYAGEFAGTTVVVDGVPTDEDEVKFLKGLELFEETTGIEIKYIGSKEFEASIAVRVDAGDAPDIAAFPQPGLLASFVRQGKVIDPTSWISDEWLTQQYNQSWLDMATMEGQSAGVWHRYNAKSLVWYPKAQFEAAGYEVPQTWDEMLELTQMIADDGDTAWCIGIESGAATGWVATDWTEEMMLRTTSLENYDAWVEGKLKFASPEVKNAMETWSEIWFNDDYVYGGTDTIVTTFIGDSPVSMFENPPKCWFHRQANWITGFFPETVTRDDYDFFYFPPVDEEYGKPFLIAGDIMTMFNDRPEVRATMEYFTVPESVSGFLEQGGALAAHKTVTPDMYGQDIEQGIAKLIQEATSFRFDASDLMPGEVGAGSFWKGMTDYVSGAADLDTVLNEIDTSWPEGVAGLSESSDASEEEVAEVAEEANEPPAEDSFLSRAYAGEFDGTTVVVDGPFTDEDEVKFRKGVEAFEEATGITVDYIGSKEFEASISVRIDAGDAPDIADFPQPGLLASFVRQGKVVDPTSWMSDDWLKQQYNQSWLDMAVMEGQSAGVWHRYNAKSLVWYPKGQFEAAGYEVPQTWDEMLELTQMIADDGDSAWCIGIESGAATGWTATDWTEDMMLRTTSLENYDAWVAGELKFASPEVKTAIETWGEIWFNDEYVLGGTDSIVTTFFGDSPVPMFDNPPKCWLHRQGNFVTSFMPDGADYGFFYLPPVGEEYGKPFLVAGDIMAMFNDRPEVRATMEYFTTPESAAGFLQQGGALAAHQTATPDMYGQDVERGIAELVQEATSFRFDASDLMPGEVGAGSFWKGMTDYVSGAADLDTVLDEIDTSWPEGVAGLSESSDDSEEEAAEEANEPPAEDSFLSRAYAGEFDGTTVVVDGPFTDEDEVKFRKGVEAFEEATGITVDYIGSKEFEASISVRIDAGDAPDIADFPQPGLLASFVRQGKVTDPTSWMSDDWLKQQYNQSWLDMAVMEGQSAGVWHRYNAKSLVWYPKGQFEAAGYEVPQTWDEMLELTQMIADDGDSAWCIGIESGAATGWTATDWTEDMMLRTTSLENYDAWVAGELKFASPEVKTAIETWGDIWFNDEYVLGGTDSIVTTFFGDSPVPMFDDPPKCWLHRQGNFVTSFMPDGADYGFFYLPPVGEEYGKPFLVAGDIMAMFNDRPEVRATMEYFTTPESAAGFLQQGGALAAHQTATPDMYGQDIERGIAELVQEATSFRFDASDLMPGEVGAGSFWKGMTDYVSGAADLDTVLDEIDASWP
ncbi:ABC transporter substrate-binding protein [Anaerolineales bacterium HSG24]|nr:ABC transporter substrate-binding protein [Anaerolineales bacterium HSG24]